MQFSDTEAAERRYIRHPLEMPVTYRTLTERPRPVAATTRNVGYGGLCFRASERLDAGQRLELELTVGDERCRLAAQVVWCQAAGDRYDVGVRFPTEAEAFRARMAEQACHIEEYRRRVANEEQRPLSRDGAAHEWIARNAAGFPRP